jgi:SAM-dependent methyltransferase
MVIATESPGATAVTVRRAQCPACGGRGSLLGRKNGHVVRGCAACGSLFTDAAAPQSLTELYDHYYDRATFTMNVAAAATLDALAASLAPARHTGRWLDVGFGEGGLLDVAGRHGWQCFGTEVSPGALAYGARRGWTVTAEAEADPRFVPGGFDVVTMIELLEHVPAPTPLLSAAARWLRPGGLLYLTTPNAASLNRRLLGLDWSIVSPPEHLVIWSAAGLRKQLTQAGFAVRTLRTEGLNPFEIKARWRKPPAGSTAPSRNTTGFALNQAFASSPWRRGVKRGINHLLSLFRLGDTLKVLAVRRAGPYFDG